MFRHPRIEILLFVALWSLTQIESSAADSGGQTSGNTTKTAKLKAIPFVPSYPEAGRKLPTRFFSRTYYRSLPENAGERRLLLEMYFLLIQKSKLEKITEPSPKIDEFMAIIHLQLMNISRMLKKSLKFRMRRRLAFIS